MISKYNQVKISEMGTNSCLCLLRVTNGLIQQKFIESIIVNENISSKLQ